MFYICHISIEMASGKTQYTEEASGRKGFHWGRHLCSMDYQRVLYLSMQRERLTLVHDVVWPQKKKESLWSMLFTWHKLGMDVPGSKYLILSPRLWPRMNVRIVSLMADLDASGGHCLRKGILGFLSTHPRNCNWPEQSVVPWNTDCLVHGFSRRT